MSVIAALTAQTNSGVRNCLPTPPEFIAEQLDAVFSDGAPNAVKIGMLANAGIVDIIAQKLAEYNAKNIILDTVFASSSGYELLDKRGIDTLKEQLLPLATVVTPNIPEAEVLTDMKIRTTADMESCARKLASICAGSVIITGGHSDSGSCDDLLLSNGKITWFRGEKIESGNTHGTGCMFSSALACNLALGKSIEDSTIQAKEYVATQIREADERH